MLTTKMELRVAPLRNLHGECKAVQLRLQHSPGISYMMAYLQLEPIPAHLHDPRWRTHQFVLDTKSVSRAHYHEQLGLPNHSIAISFTIGAGHKHLGVGVGKHYYWAEHQIWRQAPYGGMSRMVRVNGVPMARLHVVLDENLSRTDNILAIEDAIGDIIGEHHK